MKVKRWATAWLTWLVAAFIGAPAVAAIKVTDDRGASVELAQPARRVVSLLPSLTETICSLGACERLVAVDRWSNWPASVQGLPRAGGLEDADLEVIVSHRPDLVVAAPSTRVAERLRRLGITVVELDAESLGDVRRVTQVLGRLLGRETQALQLWTGLQAELAHARRTLPASVQGTRVYMEVGSTPYAASEASFIGELLAGLGAVNVVPGTLGPFPQINPEFVVRADPALIIVAQADAPLLAARPGWAALSAVRERRVCAVASVDFEVMVRPGPRLGAAARSLARCLAKHAPGRASSR